MKSCHTDFVSR